MLREIYFWFEICCDVYVFGRRGEDIGIDAIPRRIVFSFSVDGIVFGGGELEHV